MPATNWEVINLAGGSEKERTRTYVTTQNVGVVFDVARNLGIVNEYKQLDRLI